MKSLIKSIALLAVALSIPVMARAQYALTTSDTLGNSSFNTAGHWSSGSAPAAGSTYSTAGWLLRSPTVAGNYTFAGDSLTIGGGSGAGAFSTVTANNNALIFKASGVTLTVNNLILDGSQIRDGNGSGQWAALNGNITVTANGGAFIAQDTNFINSAINGQGTIYIGDNGSGEATRLIVFTSPSSTFTGNVVLNNTHANANYSRLMFDTGSLMNFAIGANGVNNNISGQGTLALNGIFGFNLGAAANVIGNSWDIVDATTTTTYGATFSVLGFTQNGLLWDQIANGVDYQFSQATGLLTVVPEPSTLALCSMGLIALAGLARRKK